MNYIKKLFLIISLIILGQVNSYCASSTSTVQLSSQDCTINTEIELDNLTALYQLLIPIDYNSPEAEAVIIKIDALHQQYPTTKPDVFFLLCDWYFNTIDFNNFVRSEVSNKMIYYANKLIKISTPRTLFTGLAYLYTVHSALGSIDDAQLFLNYYNTLAPKFAQDDEQLLLQCSTIMAKGNITSPRQPFTDNASLITSTISTVTTTTCTGTSTNDLIKKYKRRNKLQLSVQQIKNICIQLDSYVQKDYSISKPETILIILKWMFNTKLTSLDANMLLKAKKYAHILQCSNELKLPGYAYLYIIHKLTCNEKSATESFQECSDLLNESKPGALFECYNILSLLDADDIEFEEQIESFRKKAERLLLKKIDAVVKNLCKPFSIKKADSTIAIINEYKKSIINKELIIKNRNLKIKKDIELLKKADHYVKVLLAADLNNKFLYGKNIKSVYASIFENRPDLLSRASILHNSLPLAS